MKLINNIQFEENYNNYQFNRKKIKYTFKNDLKYTFFSISLFSMLIIFPLIRLYEMFIKSKSISKSNVALSIFAIVLIIYGCYSIFNLISYKIIIENDKIIHKKTILNILEIEEAVVKIMAIPSGKVDRCLVVIDKNKKQYIYRLNITNKFDFLKLIDESSPNKVKILK